MEAAPAAENVVVRQVRTVEIPIPVEVLTAADCPDRWAGLPSASPLTGKCISFKVPDGSVPGCILKVPTAEGTVDAALPETCSVGDPMVIMQREDLSWRASRKTTKLSFRLPRRPPGTQLAFRVADGSKVVFAVPEHLEPGTLVVLKRDADGGPWSYEGSQMLPAFTTTPWQPEWATGQYRCILQTLKDRGYTKNLPSLHGALRVSVPFCGNFNEYATLGSFLAEHCLQGLDSAEIFGLELSETCALNWAIAQQWFENTHPNIALEIRCGDLAEEVLPPADLTIGIHPEVTKGGCWFRIIGSIVRSSVGGICVFATFYEVEMKTLVNMIDMHKVEGTTVEVMENPFYENHEKPPHAPMSYIIVVDSPLSTCTSERGS
eukprot:TRINITY_DN81595_c0_g1_i1.p1 TRINITY_DN81595_c0_g1~~TRINITY_DN81595_c0_g1_i1.p1  ORF type:complete len:377 (+),score=81.76 TRINITY_DN81595_c0_g1_i1:36-1166(+)